MKKKYKICFIDKDELKLSYYKLLLKILAVNKLILM